MAESERCLYLQVRHAGGTDGIHGQRRAGKAHKVGLLWEEAVPEQPPGRGTHHPEVWL